MTSKKKRSGSKPKFDHLAWNMVVRKKTREVVFAIPPHVEGTMGTKIPSDCTVVEVDPPDAQQRTLYREGNARVEGRAIIMSDLAKLCASAARQIDQITSSRISDGFEYNGARLSLSSNAIVKFTALQVVGGSMTDKCFVSTLDETALEIPAHQVADLAHNVLSHYSQILSDGASRKAALASATDVNDISRIVADYRK